MPPISPTKKRWSSLLHSTRRDAEVAKEYLQDQDIEMSVRADDAGGMHPQLWRPHGVKLAGSRVQPVE